MCGISGFNWKDEGKIRQMVSVLSHRGPDASGIYADASVSLGHNRLSIIDLSEAASQPMLDASESLALTFNGEIYNYRELKKELSGYPFKSESDTEVILAGYRRWGERVVDKLDGIFAFGIWDSNEQKLFCARDHMGVKPFYYYWDSGKFIFASELDAILLHDIPRKLDLDAFNEYLRVLYVPEPQTLVGSIRKLSPGHTLSIKGPNLSISEYYKPEYKKEAWTYGSAQEAVRETVQKTVEKQLIADVPIGVYLSGGIDSSIVLASARKIIPNLETFSVGFELEQNEDEYKFNRDSNLARETARRLGAKHHELLLGVKEVADSIENIIGSMDDPISNPTAIPMAHLSKFAKQNVKVVLSGNGGDELFGGYERYRKTLLGDFARAIPGFDLLLSGKYKELVSGTTLDLLALFEFEKDKRLKIIISEDYLKDCGEIKEEFRKYTDNTHNRVADLMLADLRSWLPDQALMLGDKMSMYGSLEERVPFLGKELVDLAMRLPVNFKITPFTTKKILRDAFRGELPEVLFNEPKRGWFAPGAKWLRRPELKKWVKEVISEDYYPETRPLFNWRAIEAMLEDHIEKREYNLTILWAIVTFQIWSKRYNISV